MHSKFSSTFATNAIFFCPPQTWNLQFLVFFNFIEEWKRRYEKEKEKNTKLRAVIQHLEKELARWRNGESVPVHERFTSLKDQKPIEAIEVPASPSGTQLSKAPVTVVKNELSEEERKVFDEERSKLYTQLDERVCFGSISFSEFSKTLIVAMCYSYFYSNILQKLGSAALLRMLIIRRQQIKIFLALEILLTNLIIDCQ